MAGKEREVVLKLKVKAATAADLKKAFAGVEDAAKKATAPKGGTTEIFKSIKDKFKSPLDWLKKAFFETADKALGLGETPAKGGKSTGGGAADLVKTLGGIGQKAGEAATGGTKPTGGKPAGGGGGGGMAGLAKMLGS